MLVSGVAIPGKRSIRTASCAAILCMTAIEGAAAATEQKPSGRSGSKGLPTTPADNWEAETRILRDGSRATLGRRTRANVRQHEHDSRTSRAVRFLRRPKRGSLHTRARSFTG